MATRITSESTCCPFVGKKPPPGSNFPHENDEEQTDGDILGGQRVQDVTRFWRMLIHYFLHYCSLPLSAARSGTNPRSPEQTATLNHETSRRVSLSTWLWWTHFSKAERRLHYEASSRIDFRTQGRGTRRGLCGTGGTCKISTHW